MAAHNITNILRGHVEKQERPMYLHPVDKDNNHPWLEREGKSASPPKDTPGPSQQASSSGGRAGRASRAGRKRQTGEDGDADKEKGGKRIKAIVTKKKATTIKDNHGQAKGDGNQGQGSYCGQAKSTNTKDVASAMETDS